MTDRTAVETVQAAIEKLEAQRAASAQWVPDADFPELAGWYCDTDGSGRYGVFVLRGEESPGWPVVLYGDRPDIDLIVTLHRTIDAQLAILRFGIKRQEAVDWTHRLAGDKHREAASLELNLALAILGEVTS